MPKIHRFQNMSEFSRKPVQQAKNGGGPEQRPAKREYGALQRIIWSKIWAYFGNRGNILTYFPRELQWGDLQGFPVRREIGKMGNGARIGLISL